MAQVQRPSGVSQSGGKGKYFLGGATLVKVENVSYERILKMDLNHYQKLGNCVKFYFTYKI